MNLNASDLDKMMQQQKRTAGRFTPVRNGRGFSRFFLLRPAQAHPASILFGGLFLLGMLVGTLLVSRSSPQTLEALQTILGGYVESRGAQNFTGSLASTFSSIFVSLLILFFCGFCSISLPIILAVPLLKGLGFGFSVGTLYLQYGADAFAYVAVLLFPAMFLGALLLVAACRASTKLSVTLFRTTMLSADPVDSFRVKRYCVKYAIFTACCALIALLDALISFKFGGSILL